MEIMTIFGERLTELMVERGIRAEELAERLGVNQSTVRDWKRSKYLIFLDKLIKLANCLECSIEFLVGRTDTIMDFTPRECPPFYDRLRAVMAERGYTRYRVVKETGIWDTAFSQWKRGANPHILTLAKLSTCLGITIDNLIGREE